MSLDDLIDDPNATAEDILAGAGDPREIIAASEQVLARAAAARIEAEAAAAANEAAQARLMVATGTPAFWQRLGEQATAAGKAQRLLAEAYFAWHRYKPWAEALARIAHYLDTKRVTESN